MGVSDIGDEPFGYRNYVLGPIEIRNPSHI